MSDRRHWLFRQALTALRPPVQLDCVGWNAKYGRLSSRDSANPGGWSVWVTPYAQHWLDIASARKLGRHFLGERDPYAHLVEQAWVIKGAQVGLTRSLLLALLGWYTDEQPAPTGWFQPRKEDLPGIQAERVLPFFEESPRLARHLPAARTEAWKRRIGRFRWNLPTLTLYWLASTLAAELRSKPLCNLLFDEFDLVPLNVGGQGDPIQQALRRSDTFARRRFCAGVTTPTFVDALGWRQLLAGSHERIMVACLRCGAHQQLEWDGLRICDSDREADALTLAQAIGAGFRRDVVEVSDAGGAAGLARWACAHCGRLHTTAERDRIVSQACRDRRWVPGKWEMTTQHPTGIWTPWAEFDAGHRITGFDPPKTIIRSGHVHSLHSTFVRLSQAAAMEMHCITAGSEDDWIAHRNTMRAEPTLPAASAGAVTPEQISLAFPDRHARRTAPAPAQKLILTIDQQGNEVTKCKFHYVFRAWGPSGESWLVDAGTVEGWDSLDKLEQRTFSIAGAQHSADAVAMDAANGNLRVEIQQWAQAKAHLRLLLHGRDRLAQPIVQRTARDPRNPGKRVMLTGIRYYYTDPDAWKTRLHARVSGGAPDLPGWHLCDEVPDVYMASLGSEHQARVVTRTGRAAMKWLPRTVVTPTGREQEREDTHWWDCEHMQLACAYVLKFDQLRPPDPTPVAPVSRGRGFLDGYRI